MPLLRPTDTVHDGVMEPVTPPRRAGTAGRVPTAGRPPLLIGHTQQPAGLDVLRLRAGDRALARWQWFALDAKLAAGCPPDGDRLLAARARVLVRPASRKRLARDWDHLLEIARDRPATVSLRAPLCRNRVLAAEPEIQRMLVALRASLPVPARGVAIASHLLADGTGPVHNRRSPVDLRSSLEHAAHHMDPATHLMAPVGPP